MSQFRKVSHDDIKKMIKVVDKDGSGQINYQEFIKMMEKK
jgi:Ca2+-binding EF-hand superfamily protein